MDLLSCPLVALKISNTSIDDNILAALIGASVSLVVLIITIFNDRLKARKREENKIKKKLIFFSCLIRSIIDHSSKQSGAILSFSDSIGKNLFEFPLMTYYSKNDTEKIAEKINEELFFNAYLDYYSITDSNAKTFKNIIAKIEYQNLQLNQLIEMMKRNQKDDYERKKQFQKYFNLTTDTIADAIVKGLFINQQAFLDFLTHNLAEYRKAQHPVSDIRCAYDKFINPVNIGMLEKKYFESSIGLQINDYIHKASSVYNDISMHMKKLNEDTKEIGIKLKRSGEELKEESYQLLNDFNLKTLNQKTK